MGASEAAGVLQIYCCERKNKMKKLLSLILATMMLLSLLAGCTGKNNDSGNSTNNNNTNGNNDQQNGGDSDGQSEVRKVIFGMRSDLLPASYLDENGNPTGQNYEVMTLVDEKLPQYEFAYEAVDADTILVGIETGKYVGGLGNYFWNEERAAQYLFAEEPIGAGIQGMVLRKEFEGKVNTLADLATYGLNPVPIGTTDSSYTIYAEYNEENPDNQIKFEVGESVSVGECTRYIMEGRYDVEIMLKSNYDTIVEEIDPNGETIFVPISAIETWALYDPDETELVAAIDDAMRELIADGTLSQVSEKWFGEDIYEYID